MKVLIAPMAAMAETSGPFSRARALAIGLLQNGHTPAFCTARDVNYQRVEGVPEYFAPLPSPMGLPMAIGKRAFTMAQLLGIQQRRHVHSFEEVLFIVGAIQKRFFAEDVSAIRAAIRDFKPDVLYAEFRPAAIVAGKMENLPVATGYSYPVRRAYASSPQYSQGVKHFLRQHQMPEIESVLDIFEWADLKIVPSCHDLEPINDPKVLFTGPFQAAKNQPSISVNTKNAIVVYMGNGSITYTVQLSVLGEAFRETEYQIYLPSYRADPADYGNIHVAKRFDFDTLLPGAVSFINHGGQNSILTGILHGVPQIVYPGNVFERQYNADSIERLGLGRRYSDTQFKPEIILNTIDEIRNQSISMEEFHKVQCELRKLGGVEQAIQGIFSLC